jgi:hypothetical protein
MEFISLGSNCSVTYQLDRLGLRTQAYPFDWSKVSLIQLIDVLSNNFIDYTESIKFIKESYSHPIVDLVDSKDSYFSNSGTIIVSNKYGIKFAHELASRYGVEEFRIKIKTRIDRFRNLSTCKNKIKFIRIELSPIKSTWKSQITQLINLLDMIVKTYELVLIINSQNIFEFPPNIKIYKFNQFNPDWKMDLLNWNDIFNAFYNGGEVS